MPPVATTQTPRPAAVEPRAPGNETAGNIGIWTGIGTLGDTGNATAPANLNVTGNLTVTGTAVVPTPTDNTHVATMGYVESRITDVSGGTIAEAPGTPVDAIWGRKSGTPNTWDRTLPLAGGTLTGALTAPNLTVTTTLTVGAETVATQTWVNGAITTALGTALTVAALRALLDNVYVRRETS